MTDTSPAPDTATVPPRTPQVLDLDRAVVAFGVALLATAVVLSTFYSRARPELDWSNYAVGLLATVGLLGVSVAAGAGLLLPSRIDGSTDLVAWPGAFGAAGAGLMTVVALDDSAASAYVGGAVVVAISLAGLVLTRRGPFEVSAIGGLFVVYAQLFDDVVGIDGGGDDPRYWPVALGLLVFAVGVTAAGWRLPTRALSGIVSGVITVAGFGSLTGVLAISGAFMAAFQMEVSGPEDDFADYVGDFGPPDITNDTWIILVLALLLMVAWTGCAVVTGHVGFRILAVAMAVTVTPMATIALQAAHPTWWGVVLATAGGAALLATMVRASRRTT